MKLPTLWPASTFKKSKWARRRHDQKGPNEASLSFASSTPSLSAGYRNFISRSYFPPLDGLRCLSIVAVVAHHAGILSRGIEGVSLFFVISGFLITTILLREQSITGSISLKRFYLLRTLHI